MRALGNELVRDELAGIEVARIEVARAGLRRAATALAVALAVAATGCGDDDAPAPDAGPGTDAGPGVDGGPPPDDAGMTGMDSGPPPACAAPTLPTLATEAVATGTTFARPVFLAQAPGNTDTLWIVEQGGRIRLVRGGAVAGDFLDLSGQVDRGSNERGLLGLAFHPGYATNGRFFVYYNPRTENLDVVAEYRVSSDPDVAEPTEVRRLVAQDSQESNHNGGMLTFGPDGFLYAGLGDGGGGGDGHGPIGNGLNRQILLGKILRLDVDNASGAFAAAGNPFSGSMGLPQIWAYGVRNPWRFSFDRLTGDLYIGDVGQNQWEEIDIQPASSTGGENYGWRAYEAFEVFRAADVGEVPVHTEPVLAVEHGSDRLLRGACSIAGGYVYAGSAIPELRGVYFFGDYCSSDIAAFRYCGGMIQGAPQRVPGLRGAGLSSFGQDNAGELYLLNFDGGQVLRVIRG